MKETSAMRVFLAFLVLGTIAATAPAQWRRMDFAFAASNHFSDDLYGSSEVGGAHGWMLFDTSAPPASSGPSGSTYTVQSFEVTRFYASGSFHESMTYTELNADAQLSVLPMFDFIVFSVYDPEENEVVGVQIFQVNGDLFEGATLPDSNTSYRGDTVSAFVLVPDIGSVGYDFTDGEQGMRYRVSGSVPPAPRPCSEVDLAEPYGVLNFDDVLAFLGRFGEGCEQR